MPLAITLSNDQIAAAGRLHERLEQWRQADAALLRLRRDLPGFDPEACLLKAVAVNTLYSTHVLAIGAMAHHIESVMKITDESSCGHELVDRIAALSINGDPPKNFTSFASKFCHFFAHEEKFPIYDDAARVTIKLHLGRRCYRARESVYQEFCDSLNYLRRQSNLNCSSRDIDRYLWITGMYIKWIKGRDKENFGMNVELRRVFEFPTRDEQNELSAMLPATLHREFACEP